MSLVYELGISSADAVTLPVKHAAQIKNKKIQNKHRARSGKLYTYTWANYLSYELPVDYVSNAVSSVVNSWWETDTELLLFVTSDSTTEVHSVVITNKDTPLSQFNKPYDNLKKGKITVETY